MNLLKKPICLTQVLLLAASVLWLAPCPGLAKRDGPAMRQLERMVADRPQMLGGHADLAEFLGPELLKTICSLFDGEHAHGQLILWDGDSMKREPLPVLAKHRIPMSNRAASIMVRRTLPSEIKPEIPLSCDLAWSAAIFELHNVANYESFYELIVDTMLDDVDESEFMWRLARIEFDACKKAESFYREHWRRRMLEVGTPSRPQNWVRAATTFEAWYSALPDDGAYLQGSRRHYQQTVRQAQTLRPGFRSREALMRYYMPRVN